MISERDARESAGRSDWRPRENREGESRDGQPTGNERVAEEKAELGVHIKVPHHTLALITHRVDPSLITQGWANDTACPVAVARSE
jgi:hypothetical protein